MFLPSTNFSINRKLFEKLENFVEAMDNLFSSPIAVFHNVDSFFQFLKPILLTLYLATSFFVAEPVSYIDFAEVSQVQVNRPATHLQRKVK